jgi:hypothetical protein
MSIVDWMEHSCTTLAKCAIMPPHQWTRCRRFEGVAARRVHAHASHGSPPVAAQHLTPSWSLRTCVRTLPCRSCLAICECQRCSKVHSPKRTSALTQPLNNVLRSRPILRFHRCALLKHLDDDCGAVWWQSHDLPSWPWAILARNGQRLVLCDIFPRNELPDEDPIRPDVCLDRCPLMPHHLQIQLRQRLQSISSLDVLKE